ncbi:MAG: HEPN domain-containing protein [Betaproteobacteria bacterium]|nr:HEPN domain-containing protein [Betaproteobacteria bacterium]
MAKARQAAVSARVLLDTGDADGACNRAYYAMFDAARAALLASGAPVEPEIARTHSGLISAFSLHLVKAGRVPVELGKALNKVEDLRLMADYKGDPIEDEEAGWAVSRAEEFVQAMQSTFIPEPPEDGRGGAPRPF